MIFSRQNKQTPDVRTKLGKVLAVENGLLDVVATGGSAVFRKVRCAGSLPNEGDKVMISFYRNNEIVATPVSTREADTVSTNINVTGGGGVTIYEGTGYTIGDGLYLSGGNVLSAVTKTNRTQITSGAIDVDTSLLPSPLLADAGKSLIANGANSSSWGWPMSGTLGKIPYFNTDHSIANSAYSISGALLSAAGYSSGGISISNAGGSCGYYFMATGQTTGRIQLIPYGPSGATVEIQLEDSLHYSVVYFRSATGIEFYNASTGFSSYWSGPTFALNGDDEQILSLQYNNADQLQLFTDGAGNMVRSNRAIRLVNIDGTAGQEVFAKSLKLGTGTVRAGAAFDIVDSGTGSIGNVPNASLSFSYGSGFYWNSGGEYKFDIYAYRDFGATRVFSATTKQVTATDNGNDDVPMLVLLSWDAVADADGYRVIVTADSWSGVYGGWHFDVPGTSATIGTNDVGYIDETGGHYVSGSTVTPKTATVSADFYVTTTGDLYSTRNFHFNNYPSLTLSGNNGLRLTGINAKTLSLPTTAYVNLGGLSVKGGTVPAGPYVLFPSTYNGSLSSGIRFEGGQTMGGLSSDDGILEFWNNFERYCNPVSGHLQAVLRFDTRTGYESEGFVIGGRLADGTGMNAFGVNFNTNDVNFVYYGTGSVSIGADSATTGVSGLNGYLTVKNSVYIGGNIYVNSAGGMKIGTTTSQKIGFWNAAPIVQPTTGVGAASFTANSGTAVNDASTFDGYTIKQVVKALRNIGLLA